MVGRLLRLPSSPITLIASDVDRAQVKAAQGLVIQLDRKAQGATPGEHFAGTPLTCIRVPRNTLSGRIENDQNEFPNN